MRPVEICKRGLCTSKCFSFDLCWSHFDLFCLVKTYLFGEPLCLVLLYACTMVSSCIVYTVCVHINYRVDRQTSTVTLAAHAHRGLISLSSLVIASEKLPRSSRPTHAGLGTRPLLLRMRESLVLETAVWLWKAFMERREDGR